mmetsp:Transcript_16284/g.44174  ORF Transcript_16284/g.44174 Transcript_16284/m.44174 type:complete len:81 (-) Transcript_16284:1016-1258(-)
MILTSGCRIHHEIARTWLRTASLNVLIVPVLEFSSGLTMVFDSFLHLIILFLFPNVNKANLGLDFSPSKFKTTKSPSVTS